MCPVPTQRTCMDSLIDRELLFGNPERALARISPDGRWLSWLAAVDGVQNVFVAPVADLGAGKPVTNDTVRGIRDYSWAQNSEYLLYVQDKGGDENWHVYAVALATRAERDLTPGEAVQGQLLDSSVAHPDHIVLGINDRVPELHDWYRVNVRTGERELLLENPGFLGGVFDHDLKPRLGMAMRADGGLQILRLDGDAPTPFMEVDPEDAATTSPVCFSADGATLYALDSRGRDTGALVAMDWETGSSEVLAEDPQADVSDAWVHPETGEIQVAVSVYDGPRLHVLDGAVSADLDLLTAWGEGEIQLVSRTSDDRTWLVAFTTDDGPVRYVLLDRDAHEITHLFDHRPSLNGLPLARRRPAIIRSRDGLDLVSYLTLPRWLDQDGSTPHPLPMVLMVHGGPWARDQPGFDAQHQLLANRGYAVLSVNFRGSTGFGKAFLNAANFEWAGKMHDDLLDAVDWAVSEGIAARDKVAIMGGSYGGYATLVGLTFTPNVFACGVDIVGPSSIITLLETIPAYWAPAIAQFTSRVGEHRTEEGRAALWASSPLSRVDAIRRPLLIAQGANDPRVKQAESDQIVAAMHEHQIPVTYVLFPDEGHGFARPVNRLAFMALTEEFLMAHLGGRAQDRGSVVEESTAQVS
jgi:dipeptidyl aminopeptidase/acylaminoacyl peptidase